MTESIGMVRGQLAGIIPIHFNVQDHAFPLSDFIETASQAEAIVQELNEQLFNGKARYNFLVLPSEPGTFKTKLAIVSVVTASFVFLESDIGQSFVIGLTDHKPSHWAEQVGISLNKTFSDDKSANAAINQATANLILSESTKGFLSKDHSTLRKTGITKENMRGAYEAKNTFYKACHENDDIKSIGFTEEDEFPIQRTDFLSHIVQLPPKEKDDKDGPWTVMTEDIIVTSPNWDPFDGQRLWKARYAKGTLWVFTLEDEFFWDLISRKKLTANVPDFMRVQLAFIEDGKKRKSNRVLRVLEFNGEKVSPPLEGDELAEKLGEYQKTEIRQKNLFEID
ncbi:MAG: hypothetical protein OQJ97_13605 [Rhodospirillales bacterium]|nr:hypothetical protein [Rhodospirillales bacterium]